MKRWIKINVVDIELKDDTLLKDCTIFEQGNNEIYFHINDSDNINEQFRPMPWGNEWRYVHFQNNFLYGHIRVDKIRRYRIKEITKETTVLFKWG